MDGLNTTSTHKLNWFTKTSPSGGSVIDTVIETENLRSVPVECHGDDTSLTFHDTHLSSYY